MPVLGEDDLIPNIIRNHLRHGTKQLICPGNCEAARYEIILHVYHQESCVWIEHTFHPILSSTHLSQCLVQAGNLLLVFRKPSQYSLIHGLSQAIVKTE